MNLDAVTLKAIVQELGPSLQGGIVQKISQLGRLEIVLQLRQPGRTSTLLLRLTQEDASLGLTAGKLPPAEAPTSFVMLLRKYLQGRPLLKMEQRGLEKVVRFFIGDKVLLLELFGRSNNLYLLDEKAKILGMLVRDTKLNTQLAGKTYQPQPLPPRPDASLVEFSQMVPLLQNFQGQPASKALSLAFFGLSPLQINYICRLAALAPQEPLDAEKALRLAIGLDQWQEKFQEPFQPVLVHGKLSPWSVEDPQEEPQASLTQALEGHSAPSTLEQKRTLLQRTLHKALEKAQLVCARRQEAWQNTELRELRRWAGSEILAHLQQIEPGQERLSLPLTALEPGLGSALKLEERLGGPEKRRKGRELKLRLEVQGERLQIKLDPRLSASENAQLYFKEYQRLKRALDSLQEPLRQAQEQVEFIEELLYFTESATEVTELEDIRRQWQEDKGGSPTLKERTRGIQVKALGPRTYVLGAQRILVGRNPRQNDQLTFKMSAPGDIWLHAHQSPGAHVLIKASGRRIEPRTLEAAAILAARHCRVSQATKVEVSYCDIKSVKKPKGAPPGRVTIKNFKTLLVDPRAEIAGLEPLK